MRSRRRAVPIAASTCEGSVAPDEHDEPAAAYTLARSSNTSSASASTPRKPDVGVADDLARTITVLERIGHRSEETIDEPVAQRFDARRLSVSGGNRCAERGRHRHDTRDVRGARSDPALLAAAFDQRLERGAAAHDQRARSLGTTELVGGDRNQIGALGVVCEVEPWRRLDRVGVEHGAGRPLPDQRGNLVERLDRADLVVHEHHRYHGGALVERAGQRRAR